MYREFKFSTKPQADKKAREMYRTFGYMPNVFKVTQPKTKKIWFSVIKPRGLVRI